MPKLFQHTYTCLVASPQTKLVKTSSVLPVNYVLVIPTYLYVPYCISTDPTNKNFKYISSNLGQSYSHILICFQVQRELSMTLSISQVNFV